VVAILIGVFVALSGGRRPPAQKLPVPNGYDDVVKAGSLVKGAWPGKANLKKAEVPEIRAFVEANKAALDLARVGLGRECVAPIEDTQAGLNKHIQDINSFSQIGGLLQAEATVAEADGRVVDASKAYRDKLALGLAMTQGGMGFDMATGCNLQWQAVIGLRKLRDRLPAEEIRAILGELEDVDRKAVPVEAVEARWKRYYQAAHNPYLRLVFRLNGMDKSGLANERKMALQARQRVDRALRFLLAELAIHAYHEDKKAWPRSVKDLVPAYLAAVPVDPSSLQPIDYPANKAGELTDDLPAIARPDGEIKPRS
jgi:hypothetical protein